MKYSNLVLNFVSSCNFQGRFLSNPVPSELIADISSAEKDLGPCYKYRNTDVWLPNCNGICQNFHPNRLTKQYLPDGDFFSKVTIYLTTKAEVFILTDEQIAEKAAASKAAETTEAVTAPETNTTVEPG